MSERYEVQFKGEEGDWVSIQRDNSGQDRGTASFREVMDAFILLGKEMKCDPDMEHRVVRFVEEVVIAPPVIKEGKK